MISSDEYFDKHFDEIMDAIETDIENMNLPKSIENKFKDIVSDCEYEIVEERYNQDYSDYVDRCYEEHKERGVC